MRALLPWYVNNTLSPSEKQAVEAWLRQQPEARTELDEWRQLYREVSGQPQRVPARAVQQRIMAQIRTAPAPRSLASVRLLWGAAFALGVLVLLWMTMRPGVKLEWAVETGSPAAFRVYRAPQGSSDFALLEEIPARPGVERYDYVDTFLLPGMSYVYRIEGIVQGAPPAYSQPITSSSWVALPGQLAILLASLVLGYSIILLQQSGISGFLRERRGAMVRF